MSHLLTTGLLLMASVSALVAAEPPAHIVPVVKAQVKDRIYSTTLRATYAVPRGGRPHVEEDVLMEVGAVGTMRLVCDAPVTIVARIHTSTDGGRTFDDGRAYAALDETAAFRRLRTLNARTDLLLAEVAVKPVTVEATVRNNAGAVIGRKTYEVPAFAQQIVNLSQMRAGVPMPTVDLRMMPEARRALNERHAQQVASANTVASAGSSITEQLLIVSAVSRAARARVPKPERRASCRD